MVEHTSLREKGRETNRQRDSVCVRERETEQRREDKGKE